MRPTLLRLAESAKSLSESLQKANAGLLPPIPLYRRVLRAHRDLPREMRSLGDEYVKAEFRRHREVANPLHVVGFLSQWKLYLDDLSQTISADRFSGRRLDPALLDKMSTEQLGQLYELMHATKNVWKPVETEGKSDNKNS